MFSIFKMAAVCHLGFSYFCNLCEKNQICTYIFVVLQNLVKIGLSASDLLHIFDFQNVGRLPSWIWYDVIADHPRLDFDGHNILLKLHIDCAYILRDIAIFIFAPFGLKLPIHAHLGEFGDMTGFPLELGIGARGKKTRMMGLPDSRLKFLR